MELPGGNSLHWRVNRSVTETVVFIISLLVGLLISLSESWSKAVTFYVLPVGILYIRLLFLVGIPLACLGLFRGVRRLADAWRPGQVPRLAVTLFVLLTAGGGVLGLWLGYLTKPGLGLPFFPPEPGEVFRMVQLLLPEVLFLCFLGGLAIGKMDERGAAAGNTLESFAELLGTMGEMLLRLAPAGVAALLIPLAALSGRQILAPLAKIILLGGLVALAYGALVYGLLLRRCGKDCLRHFKSFFLPVMLRAVTGCSSRRSARESAHNLERMGVDPERAEALVELGSLVNGPGTAFYLGLALMVAIQFSGLVLIPGYYVVLAVLIVVAVWAGSGIPSGGLFLLLCLSQLLGLPAESVGLLVVAERFLDAVRTLLNVTGTGVTAYLADKLGWE